MVAVLQIAGRIALYMHLSLLYLELRWLSVRGRVEYVCNTDYVLASRKTEKRGRTKNIELLMITKRNCWC